MTTVDQLLRPFDERVDGEWTERDATHLLWRAQFGATYEEVQRAADAGLEQTLDRLLNPPTESAEFPSTARLLRQIAADTGRISDLKAWWLHRMIYSSAPLVEKMA